MKKVLMVLASSEFRDIEYIVPRAFFEQNGFEVKTASSTSDSLGRFAYKVVNDFLLKDVDTSAFDGLCFVGGSGSLQYIEDDIAKDLTLQFLKEGKIVGAICAAPRNFLHWGILKDKNATGHNWDNQFEAICTENGAVFIPDKAVVVDGNILTGNGPEASEEFALKFIAMLL